MVATCYSLLKKMENRPMLWTGENTLQSIFIFTAGYYRALIDKKLVKTPPNPDPFFDWVTKKLGFYESTAGWVNMIVAVRLGYDPKQLSWEDVLETQISAEQHAQTIRDFYRLMEDFKRENPDLFKTND